MVFQSVFAFQALRNKLDTATKFEDDLELARNEALTLKKLLIGKDRLLIQRTQELCAAQVYYFDDIF